uniref:Uncharacterized protein n=1 Tax=Clastoptera arizonana TaxID=38151 RepID=A0A1B6E7L7_9HEMI
MSIWSSLKTSFCYCLSNGQESDQEMSPEDRAWIQQNLRLLNTQPLQNLLSNSTEKQLKIRQASKFCYVKHSASMDSLPSKHIVASDCLDPNYILFLLSLHPAKGILKHGNTQNTCDKQSDKIIDFDQMNEDNYKTYLKQKRRVKFSSSIWQYPSCSLCHVLSNRPKSFPRPCLTKKSALTAMSSPPTAIS